MFGGDIIQGLLSALLTNGSLGTVSRIAHLVVHLGCAIAPSTGETDHIDSRTLPWAGI